MPTSRVVASGVDAAKPGMRQSTKTVIVWVVLLVVFGTIWVAAGGGLPAVPAVVRIGVGALVLTVGGTLLWMHSLARASKRWPGYRGFVVVTLAWCVVLALAGRWLVGPIAGLVAPGLVGCLAVWLVGQGRQTRRMYERLAAGETLTAAEVALARGKTARADIAAALLQHGHTQQAVEVLSGEPALTDLGRYWLFEAHLACGSRAAAVAELTTLEPAAASVGFALVGRARLALLDDTPAAALTLLARLATDNAWPYVELTRADALVALGRIDDAQAAMDRAVACATFDIRAHAAAMGRPAATLAAARPDR